ncbi:hypothetical protein GPJ56_007037 [Histomonas meleagridis]|uniref:uncharacterized protein n=1 Tax=Histomonas meleagridis TaxID=135588 RepID=UPI00355954CE|nr:hypothetical protein GPJ56_007037 [Histomonas meleagridis]KAH0800190.1 hypothetical protein GO595_007302 [Histomonas meleagridis]
MLRGLLQKIQDAITIEYDDEEEEEEEEEEEISEADLLGSSSIEEEETDSISTPKTVNKQLFQYYEAMKKLSNFFPGTNFLSDPTQLHLSINEINQNIQNLSQEQLKLNSLYDSFRSLSTLDQEISQIEQKVQQLQQSNGNLQSHIATLTELLTSDQLSHVDKESANRSHEILQEEFNSKVHLNEELQSSIQQLESQLEISSQSNENLQHELTEERILYTQLLNELNRFESTANDTFSSDSEISILEERLSCNRSEFERISALNKELPNVDDLENELEALVNKYNEMYNKKNDEPTKQKEENVNKEEEDERSKLSELLVKYFSGDKEVINVMKEEFGWTDEEMNQMKDENKGISGFLRKGAKMFFRFRDLWTSWLISASEE